MNSGERPPTLESPAARPAARCPQGSALTRARWLVSLTSIASISIWGFWPIHGRPIPDLPQVGGLTLPVSKPVPLELAAFRTPLWVAPPPPPAPPAAPPPPPPLKLQLIGIITEGGAQAALLFDPDQNRLITVHQGETLGDKTIERVTAGDVLIRDRSGPRTLALRPDKLPLPPREEAAP